MTPQARPTRERPAREMRLRRRGARAAALLAGGAAAGALAVWLARPDAPVPVPSAPSPSAEAPAPPGTTAPPPAAPPGPSSADFPAPLPSGADALGAEADPGPLVGADGAPTREFLRGAIASAIARHDPGLKLSSDELDAATDALWRLRGARLELRELGDDPAHAARRARLVEAIGQATADFTYYVEMSPAAFTALDAGSGRLDAPPPEVAPAPQVER